MDGTTPKPNSPIDEAREQRIADEKSTSKREDIREKIEALLEHGQYTIALFKHTRIPDEKRIETELTLLNEDAEWDTFPVMFRMLQRELSAIRMKEQAERAVAVKPVPKDEEPNGQPKSVE